MELKQKRYVQRKGSKNSISFDIFDKIINKVHNHNDLTFVDLFGGGGSMSANAGYFFKHTIYNELDKGVYDLFLAVQDDDFLKNLKNRWVTREEFIKIRNDGYKTPEENMILTTWSFGNNRESYIYGKNIERRKELTHRICFSETEEEYKNLIKQYNDERVAHFEVYGAVWDCVLSDDDWNFFKNSKRRHYKFGTGNNYKRIFYKNFNIEELIKDRGESKNTMDKNLIEGVQLYNESLESLQRLQSLQSLESLHSLQSLQSLERLQRLESLERLETYNKSYLDVTLPAPTDCVIYLDPPYRGTGGYEVDFNFEEFDNFVLELQKKGYKIFISEYNFPFGEIIWEKTKRGFTSQKKENFTGTEKLYFIN